MRNAPEHKGIQEQESECGGEKEKDNGSCGVHAKMSVFWSSVSGLSWSCGGVCCFEMGIYVFQWHTVGFLITSIKTFPHGIFGQSGV